MGCASSAQEARSPEAEDSGEPLNKSHFDALATPKTSAFKKRVFDHDKKVAFIVAGSPVPLLVGEGPDEPPRNDADDMNKIDHSVPAFIPLGASDETSSQTGDDHGIHKNGVTTPPTVPPNVPQYQPTPVSLHSPPECIGNPLKVSSAAAALLSGCSTPSGSSGRADEDASRCSSRTHSPVSVSEDAAGRVSPRYTSHGAGGSSFRGDSPQVRSPVKGDSPLPLSAALIQGQGQGDDEEDDADMIRSNSLLRRLRPGTPPGSHHSKLSNSRNNSGSSFPTVGAPDQASITGVEGGENPSRTRRVSFHQG